MLAEEDFHFDKSFNGHKKSIGAVDAVHMNRTPWSMATDGAGRDFSQTKLVGCHDNFSP